MANIISDFFSLLILAKITQIIAGMKSAKSGNTSKPIAGVTTKAIKDFRLGLFIK